MKSLGLAPRSSVIDSIRAESRRRRGVEGDFLAGAIYHCAAGRDHTRLINHNGIAVYGRIFENPAGTGGGGIGPGQATIAGHLYPCTAWQLLAQRALDGNAGGAGDEVTQHTRIRSDIGDVQANADTGIDDHRLRGLRADVASRVNDAHLIVVQAIGQHPGIVITPVEVAHDHIEPGATVVDADLHLLVSAQRRGQRAEQAQGSIGGDEITRYVGVLVDGGDLHRGGWRRRIDSERNRSAGHAFITGRIGLGGGQAMSALGQWRRWGEAQAPSADTVTLPSKVPLS